MSLAQALPLPAALTLLLLALIGCVLLVRLRGVTRRVRGLEAMLKERQHTLAERNAQFDALVGLSRSINQAQDFDVLLRGLLEQVQALVRGAQSATALMRRSEDGPFMVRATTFASPSSSFYLSESEAVARYQTPSEHIDEQVFLIRNTAGLPGNERIHRSELASSLLVLRIGSAQALEGYVVLANYDRTDAFPPQDLQLLDAVREHLLMAFDKLRLADALRLARDSADRALRFKGAFLANISHEIRTPMNAIIGFSRLGEDVERVDQARAYLRKIGHAGDTLLALVNDVLDLSRIEAGRLQLEPQHFDLHAELDRTNELFEQRALEKGIALRVKPDAALPRYVLGDPLRIRQILIHLVGNAVKFTERGRIDLRARALPDTEGALVVEFSVKDTGIGLDPDRVDSLFEAFGQGEDGTARRFGGAGLGLSIAQQLARLMDGDIQVESEPGKGSTFTVQVRLAAGDASKVESLALQDGNLRALRGLRVLLVEDNPINQEVAARILGRTGVRTTVAGDGQRAIELAMSEPFDAVLMDVHMPGLDGYQTTAGIRARPELADLPIIALTAHAVSGYRDRCLAAGMNDYLTKPIEPEILYRTLLRWTRGGASELPAIEPEAESAAPAERPAVDAPSAAIQARTVTSTEPDRLPLNLPGFDTTAALRRVSGDEVFYRRLLSAFIDDFAGMDLQLRRLLDAGEREQAKRLLHGFKGVAATVGATELADLALAMERDLAGEGKQVSQLLVAFDTSFRWACASIRDLAAELGAGSAATMSRAELDASLEDLAMRIARSDPTSESVWDTLRAQFAEASDSERVQRLGSELQTFAFRAAASTLAELRAGLRHDA